MKISLVAQRSVIDSTGFCFVLCMCMHAHSCVYACLYVCGHTFAGVYALKMWRPEVGAQCLP